MVIYVYHKNDVNEEKKFYLHGKNGLYYFSPNSSGALDEVPEGRKIKYNKSGMPYLARS